MGAPRKAQVFPVGENPTRVRVSRQLVTEPMSKEVTN